MNFPNFPNSHFPNFPNSHFFNYIYLCHSKICYFENDDFGVDIEIVVELVDVVNVLTSARG